MRRRQFLGLAGGALLLPATLPSRAATPAVPLVGLFSTELTLDNSSADNFRKGLADVGFTDSRSVEIASASVRGNTNEVVAGLRSLIAKKPALIATFGSDLPALIAKQLTSTIPVVFTTSNDPVSIGLVESLNRPGGNVTGVTVIAGELAAKRVDLLKSLVLKAKKIGLLVNPNASSAEPDTTATVLTAAAFGLDLHVATAINESQLTSAFGRLKEAGIDALLVNPNQLFLSARGKLIQLSEIWSLPTIYYSRDFVLAGGLASYGASLEDMNQQAGRYAGHILRGTKPAELPVLRPSRFELLVNLRAARKMGFSIPANLIAIADEVID